MIKNSLRLLAFFVAFSAVAQERQLGVALPRVSAAEVPLYPRGAVHANIEGVVPVKITTDGRRVITATADVRSIALLARAAEANVRTWRFDIHEPVSFTVTYRYRLVPDLKPLENNPRVTLRLPTEVEVDELRFQGTVDMPVN
jgi:hypothetical protein